MQQGNKTGQSGRGIFYIICLLGLLASTLSACSKRIANPTPRPMITTTQQSSLKTTTPYPTFTPQPTATPLPTATPDKIAALSAEFNIPGVCLSIYLVSRDQNWIGADCHLEKKFIISEKLSETKITIPYQQIFDGDPYSVILHPLSWSNDSRYFYFTIAFREGEYDFTFDTIGSL